MRRFTRRPLVWMVAAEVVVVTALVAVTWRELAAAGGAATPLVLPAAASPAPDTAAPDVPADALAPPEASTIPLLPGLNVDPSFWRDRLVGLNAAEAQLEALEWRIIHSAMDTMRRYVETVVVPALEHAEKGGG